MAVKRQAVLCLAVGSAPAHRRVQRLGGLELAAEFTASTMTESAVEAARKRI